MELNIATFYFEIIEQQTYTVQCISFVLFHLFLLSFFYIERNEYFYDRYSELEFTEKRYQLPISLFFLS